MRTAWKVGGNGRRKPKPKKERETGQRISRECVYKDVSLRFMAAADACCLRLRKGAAILAAPKSGFMRGWSRRHRGQPQMPQPLPQPPQRSSSRQIMQQLSPPKPLPKVLPFPHPQQESRRMIHSRFPQPLFPQPLLFSHPHPQFVAAKSLMFVSSKIRITLHHMHREKKGFPVSQIRF